MRTGRTDVGSGTNEGRHGGPGAWRRLAAGLTTALAVTACDADSRAADVPNNTMPDTGNVSVTAAARVPAGESAAPRDSTSSELAPARVLVVGTSLTAGLGLDPADAYPAVLQRKADSAGYEVRIVNAGLSGETSAGLARRLDWLLREPAALVVVETGANDGLRGLDPDSLRANLQRIVGTVRARLPEARVVLVQMEAPPNFGPAYTARFREAFAAVARATGATLTPFLLEGVAGIRALNQGDGIHPNEEGARRAAATVWPTLQPLLDSLDRARPTR
jgi:acyl-CoA thioesterase I